MQKYTASGHGTQVSGWRGPWVPKARVITGWPFPGIPNKGSVGNQEGPGENL